MKQVTFEKAYYIKLGKGGEWEEDSIRNSKIRIGWLDIPLEYINKCKWKAIEIELQKTIKTPNALKRDLNALKKIYYADDNVIFITFYKSKLYWCKPKQTEPKVFEDEISKYRLVNGKWSDKNIKDEILFSDRISGKITKVQGFRGTLCEVKDREYLTRLINGKPSREYESLEKSRNKLIEAVQDAIKHLFWKDFELLVDLLFRQSGWRRISILGRGQRDVDLVLENPITKERYLVQVKSSASNKLLADYARKFDANSYKKLFFIVHSSTDKTLDTRDIKIDKNIEVVNSAKLAEMIVDLGLVNWLMEKIR